MSRTITSTMQDALANNHAFRTVAKVEIYPSRIYFDALTRDNHFLGSEPVGVANDPQRQEVAFASASGLVTFYPDGGALKYILDGNDTPVSTVLSASKKVGVFGNVIFVAGASDCKRYAIDWDAVAAGNNNPFSLQATLAPSKTPLIAHAVSETECIILGDGDGGYSIHYFDGTTEVEAQSRFMFPCYFNAQAEGSTAPRPRSLESMATFSTAFKLGNRIFVYMSNAVTGSVQGIFYDLDADVWSDMFTALPTDLDISLCEFRIANSFVRGGKGYLCGQFIRTDVYAKALPYTLILSTDNGKTFSLDRFTLVSNLGYRFLATVGSDNYLYLGHCNRVCEAASTWVFDGNDDSTSPKTVLTEDDLNSLEESSGEQLSFTVKAGTETIFDNTHVRKGSRVKLFTGYRTSVGEEYILHGTYIISNSGHRFADGKRGFQASCVSESQWKLTGLSMPFYAEIFGLSGLYDPMTETSGKLYAATSGVRTDTHFWVDFWQSEGYTNTPESITPVNVVSSGGVGYMQPAGAHKEAAITKNELKDLLSLSTNPKITATSLTIKAYGWSNPSANGKPNDTVNLILVTCDEDGSNESTQITAGTAHWKITYPYTAAGTDPIIFTLTGQTVDRYIKKVGLVFECSYATKYSVSRVEFVDNVEVPVSLALANTPWKAEGDGTFKVPSAGQPFIMFSQRPYNAWNFQLTSLFENSVTGGISGYPTAVGLVGLASDASNYILARYDKSSNKAQLVKCRNGIETVLAEAAPGWTVGDQQGIQFEHRDGHFAMRMFRDSTSQYELVLEYDWLDADGYIYNSKVITKKCGIYGAIMAPFVKIMAFAPRSQDSVTNTDGLAIDPLSVHTDFPSSGQLRIGDDVFSYTGKVSHHSAILGPYQLRSVGIVPSPYGIGKPGVEMLGFDWNASTSLYANKFIAIDNGSVFLCYSSQWRVYITTGGQRIWLNRSRHYSNNTALAQAGASTSNKVWNGLGGFTGLSLISGLGTRHSTGEVAVVELSGEIKCFWFMGTGGEADTTISDLVDITTRLCGAKANFPGDFSDASLTVDGETAIFQDDYSEGFDLEFDLAAPGSFEIRTNVRIKPDNYEEEDAIDEDTGTKLVFASLGSGNYSVALASTPSGTQMYKFTYSSGSAAQHFRILYHEDNISIYHNYRWITSITLDELIYVQDEYVDIKAYSASPLDFLNVYVRDLCDWREAVYIDLETDGSSAIGSIIQERPVEMGSNPDGSLYFFYEMTRPQITLQTDPREHEISYVFPQDGASDGIVYGSDDVVTIHSDLFAEDLGFSTKLLRYPNLNTGAIEAGFRSMKKAYENREKHMLSIRPDLRVMVGDVVNFSYVLSGSQRAGTYSVIVESVSFARNKAMQITGRGYIA